MLPITLADVKNVGDKLRPLLKQLRNLIQDQVWYRIFKGNLGVNSSLLLLSLHPQKTLVSSHPSNLLFSVLCRCSLLTLAGCRTI